MSIRQAALIGNLKTAELLLEQGGIDVNEGAPNDGNTALHFAAMHGHVEIVKLLLAKGANIDARSKVC